MNLAAHFAADLATNLEPYLHYRRWCIAYSGGVDSHVLLQAIAALRNVMPLPPLAAIHINHRLNPRADDWVLHCQRVCAQLGIELMVEAVVIERDAGLGLEAAARRARYTAFEKMVGANELLLQAHHRDDQAETLLLRLLRGSGLKGLAAIPARRALRAKGGGGELLRPLLYKTRSEIMAYAQQQQLQWIDDDSNDNAAFDRNFLRLRVLPLLAERWPSYRDTLQRVTDNAAEASELLMELAALDFGAAAAGNGGLSIAACLNLSAARQRNLIFYWLRQQDLAPPSSEQLAQVLTIFAARGDAEPCVSWPGAELRRFRGCLYASKPLPAPAPDFDCAWNPGEPLSIGGCGTLRAEPISGSGLRSDREYHVRNRRGGERCQPHGRAHSQTLKKLLQEYDVAPWLRDRLPLIYCGDEIAAVADLWICEGFVAAPDEKGWRLVWQQSEG